MLGEDMHRCTFLLYQTIESTKQKKCIIKHFPLHAPVFPREIEKAIEGSNKTTGGFSKGFAEPQPSALTMQSYKHNRQLLFGQDRPIQSNFLEFFSSQTHLSGADLYVVVMLLSGNVFFYI